MKSVAFQIEARRPAAIVDRGSVLSGGAGAAGPDLSALLVAKARRFGAARGADPA